MLPTLTLLCTLTLSGTPAVESVCVQAAPVHANGKWTRSANQNRAALLIHGYHVHFRDSSVPKAEFRSWQKPESAFVKELAKHADVYSFAYGQNAALDVIVKESTLRSRVAELRKLGYSDVVLVGHSAGGLVARHFVEDYPDAGVTKVIQVCAPNGGSPLASLTAPKSQRPFLECLSSDSRKKCLEARAGKTIPDKVQFVCVVAKIAKTSGTDGVVPCACQWTADLQKQGIPAHGIVGSHREVIREAKMAELLASLMREPTGRWSPERITAARKELFGEK
jgi:pimeloyl-ACP methyl ester carboxylesterase